MCGRSRAVKSSIECLCATAVDRTRTSGNGGKGMSGHMLNNFKL